MISAYHAKYYAHELVRRHAADGVDRLSQSLFDASVDLNPHQIEAALFALRNPLQEGVLLADEVGLGKTIEAALVVCQYWAERRRRLLVICPASLRKQWAQELHDKFAVPTTVVDAVSLRKQSAGDMLATLQRQVGKAVVIMSYQFAAKLEAELRAVPWDVVVIDEAHKLRNAHRASNRTGQALKRALQGRKKLLLTATPLQNSLMELYGLSTLIDEHLFGDEAAFRKQFMNSGTGLDELRERLASFAKRTLRRDVLEYIKYTERKALTQPFNPTDDEQALYERISAFLQKEDSYALPKQQRHLTALILRKLLASSSHAVAATLVTIRERLQGLLTADKAEGDGSQLLEQLIAEDDLEQDYLEEEASEAEENAEVPTLAPAEEGKPGAANDAHAVRAAITAEIEELTAFVDAAQALQTDTKAQALLKALNLGFGKMAELRAPRKAIIFTESKRTQEYLHRFLSANGHAGKLVLFSGTNTHEESTAIYQRWLEEYKATDRVTGSPQVDRRTALIDHFRKDDGTGAEIMIATEAAAEGVNLQFCALIINYDLPWNPQRVEQRIGRCHRYGQRFDVVVINFLNTRNQADQRVLELLNEKFNLFSGVFGASDEVLGRIEGGLDFEKRILQIYDTCRQPEQIEAAFNALQAELEEAIADRIKDTQSQLLENFDEDVHDRLKLRLQDAEARLDKLGRWFWGVTRYALNDRARFDEQSYAFSLSTPPIGIATGRYQLIRGAAQPDNRKDNDKERRFALVAAKTVTRLDENGDEYEEELVPVEEVAGSDGNKELIIRFEYAAQTKGTKQEALVTKAVEAVLADVAVKARWLALGNRAPTEKNPQRTLLEKHLSDYTTKNTADYFIHKDLGGFLRRELDFYIKNEVMHLDDVQNAGAFADIEKNLRMIQCLRSIALELIAFLAQLEDFQKKLWLKKKFVVSSHYCITLDRVPEALWPEVAANEQQWTQWKTLGVWPADTAGTLNDLKQSLYRMVDTSLFSDAFKASLLQQLPSIDEFVDGLLIHSDNFQALKLLETRYRGSVDMIHVDPPYNTETSGFLYKNNYRHSSWLSMMSDRLRTGIRLLNNSGDIACHIDENEYEYLNLVIRECGLVDHGTIVWDKKNPMLGRKGVATQHEYVCFSGKEERVVNLRSASVTKILKYAATLTKNAGSVTDEVRSEFAKWIARQEELSGGEKQYKYLDSNGRAYRLVAMGAPERRTDKKFFMPLIHPVTNQPCPVPPNGWSRTPDTLSELLAEGLIVFGRDHTVQPQKIVYLRDDAQKQVASMLADGKSGKAFLDDLGLEFPYCHPVSMYEQILAIKSVDALFIDYFAGSGTNGHAVINLCRNYGLSHKQILIEMGDHFDSVLVPRLKKAVYSSSWSRGKPVGADNGISHCFKVLKLESYEDTLNNLQLRRSPAQGDLLNTLPQQAKDDYLLNYLLDVESRGSLLSVEDLKKPFDYTLNVAVDSAGAFEPRKIDLVETFNYLIGLRVRHIESNMQEGFVRVEGTLPSGEAALVIWRDCEKIEYDTLKRYGNRFDLEGENNPFDVIYINGDHNMPAIYSPTEGEEGKAWVRKIRQIEPEFLERMFSVEDI